MPFAAPRRFALSPRLRMASLAAVIALAATARAGGPAAAPPLPAETTLDAATEERILALVPERISEREVRDVLSLSPAPRIMSFQGSVPLITMAPFAEFLVAMGYPRRQLTNPDDGSLTYSSYVDARQLAGTLAWYYEREGMMPMMIGHSQGGMIAIRVLHELAGAFDNAVPVWNPERRAAEDRTTIVDPISGDERPVLGLRVSYVAALATGTLPRLLLGQWSMLPRLREIPDTVLEFTGFSLEWDPIAGNFGRADTYRATGSARVRNVTLPAAASHVTLPLARELALDPVTREWINRYVPGDGTPPFPTGAQVDLANLLHAADIWYSVKKNWCLEAQQLIRSRRMHAPPLQ